MSQLQIAYFSFGSKCKNRKPNVTLFVLSLCVIAHMYTMKLITYGDCPDRLTYRWLETYGGILSYQGYTKSVQCRNAVTEGRTTDIPLDMNPLVNRCMSESSLSLRRDPRLCI